MKKLPIGIQTFSKIIEGHYTYVDKTEIAHRLITTGSYFFLSRPRRFGKSLFLDTLKEIFEGNKTLFKGLFIEDKWDFEEKHPVIHLDFTVGNFNNPVELERSLLFALKEAEKSLGVKSSVGANSHECFAQLIRLAHEKYGKKTVVLIDEYDKPILDNITDQDTARALRDGMKTFFSVIKGSDAHLRFVLLTGVSKFSKMSLFSGLNNLNDITLDSKYAEICGYTHHDLTTTFKEHFHGVDMDLVRKWYNGYNYFGELVYNPFDILLFLDKGKEFKNYWWSTGNPAFLIKLLEKGTYFIPDVENFTATDDILNSFDVDSIALEALLWQTGYLTIAEKKQEMFGMSYRLQVPNMEIQTSLNSLFISFLTDQTSEQLKHQRNLLQTLNEGNPQGLENALTALFDSIPYQNFTNNEIAYYEGYYASVVYAYLASLGFGIIPEDVTNKGAIDLTLKVGDDVWIFEFKVVEKASGQALAQIHKKKYYQKYQASRNIYLVGIEFSRQERNIVHYKWELAPLKPLNF